MARAPGSFLTLRVPGPWVALAKCRDHPEADLWFPTTSDGRPGNAHADLNRAKRICAVCPVRIECLEYALEAGEQHGVWGGTSERERRRIRRARAKANRAA